jgi:CBS domain-containing protein
MVPGFPLDGGRILRAIIWYRKKNIVRATDIASRIGKYFALFLIGLGLFSLIFYGNFIGGIWLMIIGTFLRQAAIRSYGAILYHQVMKRLDISDLVRKNVVTVGLTMDLQTLMDEYFEKYHSYFFPVVSDGRLLGIVTIGDVKKIDPEKRPELEVKDVINTKLTDYVIGLSSSPARVFHLINARKYESYPVVNNQGSLLGVITRSDFEEAIRVMMTLSN